MVNKEEVETIISLSGMLNASAPVPIKDQSIELRDAVLECRADSQQVAHAWRNALNADTKCSWSSAAERAIFLAALSLAFEHERANYPSALSSALFELTTHNGSRLSVQGTRRELFSRTAESLFKEARRKPSDLLFNKMLVISDCLLSILILDYNLQATPLVQRGWYGMRGVCRLMLSTDRNSNGMTVTALEWMKAADDLEMAFNLGNRGPSAATYILDALTHWMESESIDQDLLTERFTTIIAKLNSNELSCRSVQMFVGRFHFALWFRKQDRVELLNTAIDHLNAALNYPPQLAAYEDHFLRHVRGQVYVRLALMHQEQNPVHAIQIAQLALDDLLWASNMNPSAYGGHPSLPSILLSRAEWNVRCEEFEEARVDLRKVLEDSMFDRGFEDFRDQAYGRLAQLDLSEGLHTGNIKILASALRDIAATPPRAGLSWAMYALAAKRVFMVAEESHCNCALLERVIACIESNIPSEHSLEYRQKCQSHLAGLTMYLVNTYRPELLSIALKRFEDAISLFDGAVAPSELISLHADFQLQSAKRLLSKGEEVMAEELLNAAVQGFMSIAFVTTASDSSDAVKFNVTHSKAGEAFNRLAALTNDKRHVWSAIYHFKLAQGSGNDTHQLLGLLGDAYYREYRFTGDALSLDKAIDLKQQARIRGGSTRENLSLSGRLHYSRWQQTGDWADLVECTSLIVQAATIDMSWPWPPFQLYEYLVKISEGERKALIGELALLYPTDELLLAASGSDEGIKSLARIGSMRVLKNEEFLRKELGGRSGVYVLADPHDLLGSSYVFKHTDKENALRDVESVKKFSDFLRDARLPSVLLPETVALFPNPSGKNFLHVMRRVRGIQMGQLAIRAASSGEKPDIKVLNVAVNCLAAYHALGSLEKIETISLRKFMSHEAKGKLKDVMDDLPSSTQQILQNLGKVPSVRKKDAHPENWLVDVYGRLVMIDFESTKGQPILYDLVLLLDDYPFLSIESDGWEERMRQCREYVQVLQSLTTTIPTSLNNQINDLYGIFLVFRCGVNIQRLRFPPRNVRDSSSTRAGVLRQAHAEHLLRFLLKHHESEGVRDFALGVVIRLGLI